jgi:O-antigen ligase
MKIFQALPFFIPVIWVAAFVAALMPFGAYEAQAFGLAFVLAAAALFLAVPNVWRSGGVQLPRSPLMLCAAGFWAVALASVIFSQAPYVSFIYFCFFSVMPLSLLLTFCAADRAAFFRRTGFALAGIFALLSLFCLYQYFFRPDMLFDGFVFLPLASPNTLSALLSLGFFCALGWMLGAPARLQSNMALVLCMLIFAALLTTGCRAAFGAMLVGLVVFVAMAPAHFKKHRRCALMLLIFAAITFAVFAFLPHGGAKTIADRLAGTMSGDTPLLWARPAIWAATWEIVRAHVWTGTGIGTFFLYYPEYRRSADFSSAGLMAHSDPLQFWAEMGVAAPLLLYAFLIGAFGRTLRALKTVGADDPRRVQIIAPFCALGVMVAHSHVSFNFYVLSILMVAGVLIGFWLERTQDVLQSGVYKIRPPHAGGFALLFAVPVILFIMLHGSYLLTMRASVRAAHGDIDGFISDINMADHMSLHKNERAFVMAASLPMGAIETQGMSLPPEQIEKIYDHADSLLRRAQSLNPRQSSTLYSRARLLREASFYIKPDGDETPESILHEALRLDPLHLGSRTLLARIYQDRGDYAGALEIMKAGLDWPYKTQDPLPYLEQTSWLAVEQGDKETIQKVLPKILRYKKKRAQQPAAARGDPVTGGADAD